MFLNYQRKTQQPVPICKYGRIEWLKFVSVIGIRSEKQLVELISIQSFPLSLSDLNNPIEGFVVVLNGRKVAVGFIIVNNET